MMRLLVLLGGALFLTAGVAADTCPGGLVRCPDFMTCCQLAGDDFGCCPFPDAKCCPDHVHCCPHNMDCDVAHQTCVRKGSSVQFFWQVPVQPEIVEPVLPEETPQQEGNSLQQNKEKSCPDETKCQSSFTCCKMYSGKYGCCPFDNGTCCQDGFHCCPHGSKCTASGECYSAEMNYTLNAHPLKDKKFDKLVKTQPALRKPHHQDLTDPGGLCPDGHPCPEKYTCCKIKGKRYGCCPYTDARCCDDGIHCCPKGTNCNTTLGTCDIQSNFGRSFPKQPLEALHWSEPSKGAVISNRVEQLIINDIICPDERYHCQAGSTCCQLKSGAYGCCPMERATCCNDGEHCCPHGFECTVGGCIKGTSRLPPFLRTMATERSPLEVQVAKEKVAETVDIGGELSDVICPDQFPCPDRNTCCQLEGGDYGCCPMEKATCCADKVHCCPHGYRCMSEGCRKDSPSLSLPLTLDATLVARKSQVLREKISEKKDIGEELSDVICPDKYSCPDRNTCCQMTSGEYGCCPMEKATCCPDKMSCCPHGYSCVGEGCQKNPPSMSLPRTLNATLVSRQSKVLKEKISEAKDIGEELSDVICPDKYSCPDHSTCCQMTSGEYGCCPMEKATCCPDKMSCCPHGYSCVGEGCQKNPPSMSLPLTLNATLLSRQSKKFVKADQETVNKGNGALCPDASECPEGATCCQLASGSYGCCAYEGATCCGDMIHCCPHGYWCSDEGCDRMPGVPKHLTPFLSRLFTAKKLRDDPHSVPSVRLP